MTDPFEAAGTLRDAYRAVDWAATPLGPVAGWSPTLRATVDLLLRSRSPLTLMWGPELVLVYNEAYVPMIGDKHPAALGAPCATVFAEIWDTIGPMLESVAAGAGATWVEDLRLLMNRRGFAEETYFTFSYSAVTGPDGTIEGVIDIASETTAQVVGTRRLRLLSRLTDGLGVAEDLRQVLDLALPVLRDDPEDLPGVGIVAPGEPIPGIPAVRIPLSGGAVLVTGLSPHLPADDEYRSFLRLIGAALSQNLNRVRARQAERRARALERDLSEALQRSLLDVPVQLPELRVAVRYRPAAEGVRIGGDWYDSFRTPDGRLTVVVGDVTGHDRRAAAGMSQIRNLLRGISYALLEPPARVLSALEQALTGLRVDVFATVLLAQFHPADRTLRWSNAGHPPPVLLTPDGGHHLLEATPEPLLGTRHPATRSTHEVVLEPGASVVFYTDGLIERRGAPIDDGLAELRKVLAGRGGLDPEQLCDLLLDHFAKGAEDDVVLVVVRA